MRFSIILMFAACVGCAATTHVHESTAVAAAPRATDDDGIKQTLIDLERKSWVAWQKRDGKFFQEFLSDDHSEVGNGGVSNKAAVVGFVGSPVCKVESYAVDHFEFTRVDATTALLTYHAAQNTTCNGTPVPSPAWVSSLYTQRNGRWLNVSYQQTFAAK